MFSACLLALFVFVAFWAGFYFIHRHQHGGFFSTLKTVSRKVNRADDFRYQQNTAFEPLLKHYIGVTQLVFTVAAGSIALGSTNSQAVPVLVAGSRLLLAWCILYGVPFCGLLWRYDEYGQNKSSFTPFWYSLVFALGFSCLSCFVFGYLARGLAFLL